MIAGICIGLAVICTLFGIILLISPKTFLEISRVTDKKYSTDKLRELLDKEISTEKLSLLLHREIEVNDKLLRFNRFIGLITLIVGIVLFYVFRNIH